MPELAPETQEALEAAKLDDAGRDALAGKIGDQLAALNAEELDEDEVDEEGAYEDEEEDTDPTDDTEGDENEEDESDDTEDNDDSSDGEDDEAASESDEADDLPTLPDVYRRSLKATGWTDGEIDDSLAAAGDKFIETAFRIHESRNAQTAEFAELGRKKREQEADKQSNQEPQDPTKLLEALASIDAAKLQEKFGDDPELKVIVEQQNALTQVLQALAPQMLNSQQFIQQQEQQALRREVDSFFESDTLKNYSDAYGVSGKMSDDQIGRRNKVLQYASDLIDGAEASGRQISVTDALELAHHSVGRDFDKNAARKEIKQTARKRSKSLSLKPGKRSGKKGSGGHKPGSRAALESKVGSMLADLNKQ